MKVRQSHLRVCAQTLYGAYQYYRDYVVTADIGVTNNLPSVQLLTTYQSLLSYVGMKYMSEMHQVAGE